MKLNIGFLLASIFLFINAVSATTIYVTESGAGSMNGSSWANAYPGSSLQIAINSAAAGDEIWVACGTYKPTSTTNRSIAFAMKNDVDIYGSFMGTEILLSDRLFSCGPCSILSGDIGASTNTDNSFQVIKNINIQLNTVIDGFVIRDGYDDRSPTLTEGLGGGILNVGSGPGNVCSPTISNCIITNNQAEFGAGIFNDGYNGGFADPLIDHCLIVNNYATGGGGGIDNFGLSGNASPSIRNTVIAYNSADDAAGGMYCWGGGGGNASPELYNCIIANNTVMNGNGGGIVADRSNSGGGNGGSSGTVNLTIINSIIYFNQANMSPQFHIFNNATITAYYSDVDTIIQFSPHVLQTSGNHNLYNNPQFLNNSLPIGLDGCWMTDDDGYQLSSGSPCIDMGDSNSIISSLDLAFNDRTMGLNLDMGAYEYTPGPMGTESTINITFDVFPNPVINELYIISSEKGYIVLLNAVGQIIMATKLTKNVSCSINTEMLIPGTYFIRDENTGVVKKIMKQ